MHDLLVRNCTGGLLDRDARGPSQHFVLVEDLFGYRLRISDQQCSGSGAGNVEVSPCCWRPTTFLADAIEGVGEIRIEIVGCLIGRICDKTVRVDCDGKLLGAMTGTTSRFAVEVNERTEAMR